MAHPLRRLKEERKLKWREIAALIREANGTVTPDTTTVQSIAHGRPVSPKMADKIHRAFPQIDREELIYYPSQ